MKERQPRPPLIDPGHTKRVQLILSVGCFTVVLIGCSGILIWLIGYGFRVRPEEEVRVAEEGRFRTAIAVELDKARIDLQPNARITGTVLIIDDKRKLGDEEVKRTRFSEWIPEGKLSPQPKDTEYVVWIRHDTELEARVFLCERKTGRLLAATDCVSRWDVWKEPSRKYRNVWVERKQLVTPEKELRQWFDALLK